MIIFLRHRSQASPYYWAAARYWPFSSFLAVISSPATNKALFRGLSGLRGNFSYTTRRIYSYGFDDET